MHFNKNKKYQNINIAKPLSVDSDNQKQAAKQGEAGIVYETDQTLPIQDENGKLTEHGASPHNSINPKKASQVHHYEALKLANMNSSVEDLTAKKSKVQVSQRNSS